MAQKEVGTCSHWWSIGSTITYEGEEATLEASCKLCESTRTYPAYFDDQYRMAWKKGTAITPKKFIERI